MAGDGRLALALLGTLSGNDWTLRDGNGASEEGSRAKSGPSGEESTECE